ncbi:MAG: metal ABC transporter ATP-binding protein [Helicobacteraceae bacterium]|jgi:zinc transport system ATP-binding protein|nr:metal ABC transporter ATP-binding protein [Helicobacteraceae bacterium]
MAAIEAKNLCLFRDGAWAIEDITFSVEIGEFVGIEGPNGGGKSTLIKILAGILKPDKGEALLFGAPARSASARIGYMPQERGENLNFPISAIEVVKMGFLPNKPDESEALDALERLGALKLARKKIGELSGGERERVFLARAIVGGVKALLLDEPTSCVDANGDAEIAKTLLGLKQTTAIVCVSHNRSRLREDADRIVTINRRIIAHERLHVA